MAGRLLNFEAFLKFDRRPATIAQLVEQLICNQRVVGSNPTGGSRI